MNLKKQRDLQREIMNIDYVIFSICALEIQKGCSIYEQPFPTKTTSKFLLYCLPELNFFQINKNNFTATLPVKC